MLRNVALWNKSLSELEHSIDEWIFCDVHRAMLKDHLLNGHSYARIAEDYNMSERQIARIIPSLKAQLYEKILKG